MAVEPVRICPTVRELPDGWQVKQLGSFCTKIGTGATPRGGTEVYLTSRVSYALVRSQHVFDRYFDASGLAFISDEHAKELRNAEIQSGDVLLNITGDGVTFGRSCIVPDRALPACVNQHVSIIRPDRRECDPGYLLSVLTHPATKGYIESFNSGGSRRAITKGHIESFEIPLPPLAEQKAIALVLGTLDDKIENNRKLNHHLPLISVTDSSPLRSLGKSVSRRMARVLDWWRLEIHRSNSGLATSVNRSTNVAGGKTTWVSSTMPLLMFCWAEPTALLSSSAVAPRIAR